jgi:hypothetical protein
VNKTVSKSEAAPVEAWPDLEAFVTHFCKVADKLHWFLLEGRKLRCRIGGVSCCPLLAVGYLKSGDKKEIPEVRHMTSAAGVSDKVAAAVVHHADAIVASRYYRPEVRRRLLKACKLAEAGPAAALEV